MTDINDASIEELSGALARKMGVPETFDAEWEKKIFADLKGTDGLAAYLKNMAALDKDRYFGAGTAPEQLVIRGMFARTTYLLGRIMKADKT